MQDIIDAMAVNAAIIDESGHILHVNQAWLNFAQNNNGIPHLIKEGSDYFAVVDKAACEGDIYARSFNDNLKKLLNNEITSFELEYPCNSQTDERWFIANVNEIDNTCPRCFLVSHKDITALVKRERRVMAAQRLEAIGRSTSGIVHDFNNLLAIITGNLELIQMSNGYTGLIKNYVDECLYATTKSEALINQLLAFARQQKLNPAIINLNEFMEETIPHIKSTLNDNIQLITEFANQDQMVTVDTTMLSSAILNLVINAQHAMPHDGRLTIKTSQLTLNGEAFISSEDAAFGKFTRLSLTDTGCGITPENLTRVLEPFFTTRSSGKGSGLGLSMVHGFIKQSHGHMSIDSMPGKGTTVSLFLPTVSKGG